MTGCTCKGPGYCERHKVKKNEHWFHLCQTRDDYFQVWEAGKGPGQRPPPLIQRPPRKPTRCTHCGQPKPWWQTMWDFGKAMASFVVSGAECVTRDQYKERLEACTKCDQLDTKTSRCKACGCFVKIKARGAVWDCPQGKWPEIR